MAFINLIEFLQNIFGTLINFMQPLFNFMSYTITIGEATFSVLTILFGVGFSAWVIYKSLPVT